MLTGVMRHRNAFIAKSHRDFRPMRGWLDICALSLRSGPW